MRVRVAALVLPWVFGLTACDRATVTEPAAVSEQTAGQDEGSVRKQSPPGSGLVLDSLTGVTVPLIGQLGDVVIDQAVITNFALVENAVGQIVGLEASGILQLSGDVLGAGVTEDFTTTVTVTSSGPGKCDIVNIDLGPVTIDALGVASIDVPQATVSGRASGAVGVLLCNLGSLLGNLTGVGGIVNAINNLI